MVIDLGVDNNCKRSEVAQYVNVQNMDGWKFVQSEIKSDCEEKELIGVKEKFDEWKKSRLLERVSETHR